MTIHIHIHIHMHIHLHIHIHIQKHIPHTTYHIHINVHVHIHLINLKPDRTIEDTSRGGAARAPDDAMVMRALCAYYAHAMRASHNFFSRTGGPLEISFWLTQLRCCDDPAKPNPCPISLTGSLNMLTHASPFCLNRKISESEQ